MSDVKYPITGSVWFRKSTQEWVLELEGSINGTYFIDRHTEPSTTLPEDVPGLPSLYHAADRIEALTDELSIAKWLLTDAAVQLEEGKIKTRRNRAGLIWQFLAQIKGENHE